MKKNDKEDLSNEKRSPQELASHSFDQLIWLKNDENRIKFNESIKKILPDINGYIARRLSMAVKTGNLPSGKYKVEDLTDELYLKAYDEIKEVKDKKDLLTWLFKKADELIENTISVEEYNERFLDNIDNYTQTEWRQMQGEFSSDIDGDLQLLEEFDDPSYPTYEYQLADAFIDYDSEARWLENLNTELSNIEVHKHIDMVLHRMPAIMRSVYDLAVNQRFKSYEIAKIKRISVYQVEQYMSQAQKIIRESITKRFK